MTAAAPSKVCDIVLKGGITSGVVYPLALESLAQEYRFANIGGTSAGAIAAAAAAAAEYGRPVAGAGFARLARIPGEIGPNLLSMFQPSPALRPLFGIFVAALKAKGKSGAARAVIGAAVSGYRGSVAVGALVGILVVIAALLARSPGFVVAGALLAAIGAAGMLVWRLIQAVTTELPRNGFGVCPGIRQPGETAEGFTDYLTRLVDEASGRPGASPPLTFAELAQPPGGRPPVNLAMMTTSLMEKRPYTLPMTDRRFFFEAAEWSKIFPARVMTYLTQVCEPFAPTRGEAGAFYHFPDAGRLPVVVAARMSLSFPLLISAVPLYTRDFTMTGKTREETEAEQQTLRRCLFSDGGLSSNFPIHFFDHLLPGHPTFAITLDAFDAHRNRAGNVWLPEKAGSGIPQPILPLGGLGGFLMRLVDAAKDWQDTLQSTLPGYRERIVHIALRPEEGGLNVAMDQATISRLVGYGKQAGDMLRQDFDLDAHRWRRFLVAGARIEETLGEVADAYDKLPGGADYPAFLDGYASRPKEYEQKPPVLDAMVARMAELARLGEAWRIPKGFRDGRIPKPTTTLRIAPKP